MDADRHDGLKAVGAEHVGHGGVVVLARGVQEEHAQPDQGVAEEDCDG